MTVNDAVATRIVKLLREKKMSQYRLEQNSFIAHGAMNNILAGKNKTVTLTTVLRLARGFNMSVEDFLNDEIFHSEELELE
ncbi:MAG: helix-turn-helix transcriptional regulator [Clostridiales bacterium]|nr:helix-turn-helix transcriptional regulator [Clostridiales bacterium]